MSTPRRPFTLDRMRQGFVSAKHWDAFCDQTEHVAACPACTGAGEPITLADGSLQPTARLCDDAVSLFHRTQAIGDSERREMRRVQEVIRRRRLRL